MNIEEGMKIVVYLDNDKLNQKFETTPVKTNSKTPITCIIGKIISEQHFPLEKAKISTPEIPHDYFFIKVKSKYERIETQDLLYLEADGSYTRLHLKDRIITISNNLKVMFEKINNPNLVRIHRKYIINIIKIKYLDDNQVFLENDISLPLSGSNKIALLNKLHLI